jgi:phosphopantothenoylcysteine decarboxylase/phosphopantothenate--cysteine ligase
MQTSKPLRNKKIILGVTGCIAAYKAAELTRALKKLGADVWVVMTGSAREFISPLTFRTLSGNPCITEMFDLSVSSMPMPHISLTESADLVLIAPATANIIGKAANGIADDVLSTVIISCTCPVVLAPAMNTRMWKNKIVEENSGKLKKRGVVFVGPEKGELACGDIGEGHISSTEDIVKAATDKIGIKQDFIGKTVLITAGGTREPIDPVRFIGNRSSGKMGYALAQAAADRGANVILISANSDLDSPEGVVFEKVKTAAEMKKSVMSHFNSSDIVIMAAAVADYRPEKAGLQKIKKGASGQTLGLEATDDILSEIAAKKGKKIIVGFSVESENLIENSKKKLKEKKLDLIAANDISAFEKDDSEVTVIKSNGKTVKFPRSDKKQTSNFILDQVLVV